MSWTYHSKNAYDTTEKLWKPGGEGVAAAAVLCGTMKRGRVIPDDFWYIMSWVIGNYLSSSRWTGRSALRFGNRISCISIDDVRFPWD
jgi:hypothetical protein